MLSFTYIIKHDSACVMNFISHDTVYSLYPFSTFCRRQSICWGVLSQHEQEAANKYEPRGWRVKRFLPSEELLDLPTDLKTTTRTTGDEIGWRFNLDDGKKGNEWKYDEKTCRWKLEYSTTTFQDNEWDTNPTFNFREHVRVDESSL